MPTDVRIAPVPETPSAIRFDVLVVGGGPAGSTVAALLAERGRRVVLVEKDRHPRFHIGESLLPLNLPLFDRLGVSDQIARCAMPKYGVEFVSPYHKKSIRYDFANAWDKTHPCAYQVRRSEFDHILLKNAAAKGAEVVEGWRVVEVDFPAAGGVVASARDETGQVRRYEAGFLVDASGRDTLLAGKLDLKQRNRKHSSAAMFGHFTGARRLPGKAEGNISIFWFDHGWFWFIPLADGTTSVGAVCPPAYFKTRNTDLTSFFQQTIALAPELAGRLEGARLVAPITATGNYSYSAKRMTGRSFLMVGDAFAFVDPVFSTGVYLAMTSAFLGAEAVETCLQQPHQAEKALKRYEAEVRRGLKAFSWYIYRIRTAPFRALFMEPRNIFRVEEAVLSLLAGDVFGNTPIGPRLLIFKALYYIANLFYLRDSVNAWRARRQGAELGPAG